MSGEARAICGRASLSLLALQLICCSTERGVLRPAAEKHINANALTAAINAVIAHGDISDKVFVAAQFGVHFSEALGVWSSEISGMNFTSTSAARSNLQRRGVQLSYIDLKSSKSQTLNTPQRNVWWQLAMDGLYSYDGTGPCVSLEDVERTSKIGFSDLIHRTDTSPGIVLISRWRFSKSPSAEINASAMVDASKPNCLVTLELTQAQPLRLNPER